MSEPGKEREPSRYVTVFHQLKETEDGERGDRLIVHGEHLDDRYVIDDELEDFVPVARPIAVIDAGVEMDQDELGEWCNSHAGKAILNEFFPDIEPDDPTLPETEEYLDDDPEIVTDGGVKQATLDGGEADTTDRYRPGTFLYCEECEEPVLRSRRLDHEHDLSDADTPTDAQKKLIEEKVPKHALLDTQTWEITFHDEYVERVRVEATTKGEAQEKAENERTYDGELMQTIHTERRALSDPSQATIEYLEFHGLLPEDHDVTPSDLQKLLDANSGGSR